MTADFSGYATRNDVRCSDGRTILADAFSHQDGEEVPLVYQHNHDSPFNLLGHVTLHNVADGVKAQAYFNDSDAAVHMKKAVKNGDVKFLSIFANQLKELVSGGYRSVKHGMIREVSLVLAGANPGARIDNPTMAHSDGEIETFTDEAEITTGIQIELELAHADTATVEDTSTTEDNSESLADVVKTFNPKQLEAFEFLLSQALLKTPETVQHSDSDEETEADDESANESEGSEEETEDGSEETETDAVDAEEVEESEENAEATAETDDSDAGVVAETDVADAEADDTSEDENSSAADSETESDTEAGDEAVQHDNINQEENSMSGHNVFNQNQDGSTATGERQYLSHDALKSVLKDTIRKGSLKQALEDHVIEHGVMVGGTLQHGIENIDFLFPDAKQVGEITWIARKIEWVDKVLNSVRKTPFTRIKTIHADITADEARARGYIKGNMKNEEFFELVKRETTPQTVYKKQKLDRDDVLDITDMDVIAFVKAEMDLMLKEEIAGAILVGDGRSNGDEDKIQETKIRPIATDSELYITTVFVNLDDANSDIEELVDEVISSRMYYKGTGLPTFYTSEEIIGKFLTAKDGFDQRRYKSLAEVATAMRVADIVPVDVFGRAPAVVGIVVNLIDYSIGTDRGGQATMFDDFDLDYNKLRYLLETRCSGALTIPKAAIVYRKVPSGAVLVTPSKPAFASNVVTIPTVTGVTYKNADTSSTITGAQSALTEGQTLNVKAVPASASFYFENDANDEWSFDYDADA